MNTNNHYRVIEEFANRAKNESKLKECFISNTDIKTLKAASDYTDDFCGSSSNDTWGS